MRKPDLDPRNGPGRWPLLAVPILLGGIVWGSTSGILPWKPAATDPSATLPVAPSAVPEVSPPATNDLSASGVEDDVTASRSDAPEPPSPEELALIRDLRTRIEDQLPLTRWQRSEWGLLVTSLDRGDTLFALGAHRPLTPASNVKLLTTAAALHHLGAGYRYRTFLLSDAAVEGGVLEGDLVLYGTGDPTLSDAPARPDREALRDLARSLHDRGIRVVDGDVVGDGSYFGTEIRPAPWGDAMVNEWFAAPVASLQYNENVATLRIRAGAAPGLPPRVETTPVDTPIPVLNEALTVDRRTRHPVWALRDRLTDPVVLTGQIQPQDPDIWRRMPVPDPPLYTAARMKAILEEEGIRVVGEATSLSDPAESLVGSETLWAPGMEDRPGPRVLGEHQSAPLLEILWVINRESHNLYAESVLRTLGRVVAGDGSSEAGTRVVRDFLIDEVGIPTGEVSPLDGSGLSRRNRVSPFALVRLLDHMSSQPTWSEYWSTLPQAGNFRELRRMYQSPAAANLRAKTGTLRTVSALSGVVQARNGERLAFSILSNDVPSTSAAKAVEDRIGIELASFWRPPTEALTLEPDRTTRAEE